MTNDPLGPKGREASPLREAHAALVKAIADLRAMDIPVPVALWLAVGALGPLSDNVIPFKPKADQ